MAILVGIDFETTGVDASKDHVVEVGFVVWNAVLKKPTFMYSSLIKGAGLIPEEITNLTGITDTMRSCAGVDAETAFSMLGYWANHADYLCAHNAGFEKSFLSANGMEKLAEKRWIDTMSDIPYQPMKGKGTLSEICMVHGVFNPMPHRALPDTMAMLQVLAQYDFSEVERYSQALTQTLRVAFPYDADRVAAVKALGGWRWNNDLKLWEKACKSFLVEQEVSKAKAAGFIVRVPEFESLTAG